MVTLATDVVVEADQRGVCFRTDDLPTTRINNADLRWLTTLM